jgi:hypothetical protein
VNIESEYVERESEEQFSIQARGRGQAGINPGTNQFVRAFAQGKPRWSRDARKI